MPKSKTSLEQLLHEIRRVEESREVLTEEKIKAMYRTLNDELTAYISKKYVQYADGDGRLYIAYLDAQNQRARFLREIANNVDSITPEVQEEITKLVNDTYKTSYKGMAEAFAKAEKAGKFAEVVKDIAANPNVLRQAVNNNISKLTLSPVLEKHRNEVIYQIQQELNIGLMQGDRYETMAKRISERVGVSYSKAMNIARTESHRNVESGFMDCAENLQSKMKGDSNLIYAVTWRTMKDERVRPNQRRKTKHGWKIVKGKGSANHQQMEGVTIKVGELFDLGNGIKTKAPGQSGDAANDCRCRCFLEYNLMTVEEFAKATGKSVDKIKKQEDTTKFKPSTTFKDAEDYAQTFANRVSYRGATDLDGVNAVNATLKDLTDKYPINKLDTLITNGRLRRTQAQANFKSLEINTSYLNGEHKGIDWAERVKTNLETIARYKKEYLGNTRYNQAAVRKTIRQLEEENKYKRWTVSNNDVAKTITHEYGHILADQYIGQINRGRANPNYAARSDNKLWEMNGKISDAYLKAKRDGDIFDISMYGASNAHEFFAETFTMYVTGEKLPDYISNVIKEVLSGGIL